MNTALHNSEYCVYPGHYVPIVNEEEIAGIKLDDTTPTPSVIIIDSTGCYKIEIALPGVERENFLVYADSNVLSIYVIQHRTDNPKKFRLREFNSNYFEHHVELAADADTEFVSAEYKEDVLHIHVPKRSEKPHNSHTRIVVY
jgi:HSP20 family protein